MKTLSRSARRQDIESPASKDSDFAPRPREVVPAARYTYIKALAVGALLSGPYLALRWALRPPRCTKPQATGDFGAGRFASLDETSMVQKNPRLDALSTPFATSKVSLALTNEAQPQNVRQILDQLSLYTLVDEILVWENAQQPERALQHNDSKVVVVQSPGAHQPWGMLSQLKLAAMARNDLVILQNDDVLFAESALARLLRVKLAEPQRLACFGGRAIAAPEHGEEFGYSYSSILPPAYAPVCHPNGLITDKRFIHHALALTPLLEGLAQQSEPRWQAVNIWHSLTAVQLFGNLQRVVDLKADEVQQLTVAASHLSDLDSHMANLTEFSAQSAARLNLTAAQLYVQPFKYSPGPAVQPSVGPGAKDSSRLLCVPDEGPIGCPPPILQKKPLSGYLALCLMFRDDLDVPEWIAHHRTIGVDAFYLYEHSSAVPLTQQMPYAEFDKGDIEYRYFKDYTNKFSQTDVYNDCLSNNRDKHQWMGFVDADEYLFPLNHHTSLHSILRDYEEYGGLAVSWRLIGSSGHDRRPKGGIAKNYFNCLPMGHIDNRPVKMLTNLKYTSHSLGPHYAMYLDGKFAVTENKQRMEPEIWRAPEVATFDLALYHYVIKSWEDFEKKSARGGGHGRKREIGYFQEINEMATEECTAARDLAAKLGN